MKQSFNVAGVEGFIEGEGSQTIVMLHGWPDTHHVWEAQVAYFKQNYRCVYFTLPGFDTHKARQAYSLEQVIATIRDVVNHASPDQPVILMLHDWGCFYGYQYALQYPERVSKIIGVDVGDAHSKRFARGLKPHEALLIVSYQLPLAAAWKIGGKVGNLLAHGVAKVLGAPADPDKISADMGYPYYIRWTGAYGSFKQVIDQPFSCPLFFIYATKKPMMFHSRKWIKELVEQEHNKVMAFDTSHWVMVEAPEQFNREVNNWLAT